MRLESRNADPIRKEQGYARLYHVGLDWFISLLVCKEVLLVGLCERKILFRLEIYDHLRQATSKRIGCLLVCVDPYMLSPVQSWYVIACHTHEHTDCT